MPSSNPDSDKASSSTHAKLFGRHRALHELFGGGRVANVILWRDWRISAAILSGATAIWFLFEIVEYHFLTLLCHLAVTAMLAVFIWCNGAALFNREPPKIPETIVSRASFEELAFAFHRKLSRFLSQLQDIARGKDLKLFLLSIASLWILSVIGSYCSFVNLLYFGYLSLQILPVLYERYEDQVEYMAGKGTSDLKKMYREFDSKVLNKIPRGPVKETKVK